GAARPGRSPRQARGYRSASSGTREVAGVRRDDRRGNRPGAGELPTDREAELGLCSGVVGARAGRLRRAQRLTRQPVENRSLFSWPGFRADYALRHARMPRVRSLTMPDERPSEKSVFLEAIEITAAAERAAYLDRACKDNPQLRAEVEALLRAHET